MGDAAEVLEPDTRDWTLRPYDASTDEDAMHYMLGIAYTRSRAGFRANAERAGGSKTPAERAAGATPPPELIAKQRAFLAAHKPIWTWLLEHTEVTLAVDPVATHIIWAWLVTSGPQVIHAVGCKRTLVEAKLAQDVVTDLLGPRLHRHQVCTLELPQMRTRGEAVIGLDRPREWSMDPTWLLTRMGEQ